MPQANSNAAVREPQPVSVLVGGSRFEMCAFCPDLCLDQCPVVGTTGATTLAPYGKMTLGWLIERGMVNPNEEMARAVYQCTGCLACHAACRHEVDVEHDLFGLRAGLVQAGFTPFPRALFEEDETDLAALQAEAVPPECIVPEAQAVVFPGCRTITDNPAVLRDLFDVFKGLRIEFVGASPTAAICCGYPLHAGGYTAAFVDRARVVASVLRRYKVVVTPCARCAYSMRGLYSALGLANGARVTTALELIAPLVLRTEREPLGLKLAWHDSCFLGRHLDQFDLPRKVLTHVNGIPPAEMRRSREASPCCGSGGGWERTAPSYAAMAAKNVVDLARDAGGEIVVTGSANCSGHMSRNGGGEVMDLISLVARWIRQ